MKMFLLSLQIVVCVLLVGCILIQAKGTGLGSTFGGAGELYSTKRGVEKLVFGATIFLGFLFGALSLIVLIL